MKAEQALTALANKIREGGETACQTTDPELWYPNPMNGADKSLKQAIKWCESCHARKECLLFALANNEEFGIWGGINTRTRQAIRTGKLTIREALEGKRVSRYVRV